MAKSKELKTGSKAKSEVQTLKAVKNAAITKPSQTPVAKSKAIAKETAAKVSSKKKVVKAATPSSSESESESEDSASDNSESEEEAPAKTNGKVNGVSKKVEPESESDSSESSDSSDSSSDDDSDASEAENATAAAAADSDESEDSEANSDSSDDSESEEETAPVAAVKKAVNGATKVVAKATETDSDSSESSSEEDSADSDNSSDSDEEEEEEAAPSKKRKAEANTEPAVKKAKVEGGEEIGSKNLFVGNLSWNVDDEWLLQEFKEFGEIAGARVISDKATGRSKGFGYVEFTNAADAAAALRAKKGALIDGREANVDFSTPRDNNTPRERAQGRAQQYGDTNNPPSDTLFLGNLSFDADENIVGEAFGVHGTVVNVRLPTDQETGNPKGFGYITFASVDECKAAFEAMAGAEIAGRPVRLDYATPRPDRGDGGRGGARGGRGGRGRGGFGDRGGRGGARGGARGGRVGSTNRGGFGDFKGKKQTF